MSAVQAFTDTLLQKAQTADPPPPPEKVCGSQTCHLLNLCIMEGKAADYQFILFLRLHWDRTVVIQLKDLPVENNKG